MKRIGRLYDKVISLDSLRLADIKARDGKDDRKEVVEHDARPDDLDKLHAALRDKTYKTSSYHKFTIKEPKERVIASLPYYPDRIVHHAIMNVLEPIWRSVFPHNTFACIKKRGIHACRRYVERIIKAHRGERLYCLKIDIHHFFPSVKSHVIKGIIRKKIKDKDLLWLLDEIIDSFEGLPVGNYTSQYMANLTLAYMMHDLNKLGVESAEYCDDICVFSTSKERLRDILDNFFRPYIEGKLELEIKGNWQIFPIAKDKYSHDGRGLDFCGYVFYMECVYMRKRIKKNMCRKAKKLRDAGVSGKRFIDAMAANTGWAVHCDSAHLLKKVMGEEYEMFMEKKNRRRKPASGRS